MIRTGVVPARWAEDDPPHDHVVQFYADGGLLVRSAAEFLEQGLRRGGPVLVLATPHRGAELRETLGEFGFDVRALDASRRLCVLDASALIDEIVVDGEPDPERFDATIGALVAELARTWRPSRVFAYGELVDLLWKAGSPDAALRAEDMWNQLVRRHRIALFCAYSAHHFSGEEDRAGFDEVCRRHGRIVPVERHPLPL